MFSINLLDWRYQYRLRYLRSLQKILGLSFILVIVFAAVLHMYLQARLAMQTAALELLSTEINRVQIEIVRMNANKNKLKKLQSIVDLQACIVRQNNIIMKLFNVLAKALPTTAVLTKLQFMPEKILITLMSERKAKIVDFVEQLKKNLIHSKVALQYSQSKKLQNGLPISVQVILMHKSSAERMI